MLKLSTKKVENTWPALVFFWPPVYNVNFCVCMAGSLAMPLWFPWIFVEYDYVGLQQILLAVQAAKQEAKKFSAHLLPCHKSLWHLALPQSALVCQLKSRNLQAIPFNEAPRSSGSGLAF